MDYIFEKNERAVRHGNHVSDIDAAYCTKCGMDIMHPVFDHTVIACSQVPEECPHRRVNYAEAARKPLQASWAVGDIVSTANSDGTMGPARIVSFHAHSGVENAVVILHYSRYDTRDVPVYQQAWVKDLCHWQAPPIPPFGPAGPAADSLTFTALRVANRARMPLFKNATGETKHSGQDWTVSDWALAVAGETGELAEVLLLYSLMTMSLGKAENVMKKMRRKDFNPAVVVDDISEELADVVIYLDMLADSLGIDLGKAVMYKWNKKSEQLDIPLRLHETHVERIEEY